LIKQAQDNGTPDHHWKFTYANGAFKIQNMNSGLLLGVDQESTANSANVVQFQDNGTPDHLWIMAQVPAPYFSSGRIYKYMNYNSGNVLAVQNESQADGAQIQQYFDTQTEFNFLTPDHLWEKDDQGGGNFILRNVLSNLVLGVDQESTANSALIKQAQNNGTPDHYWQFTPQFTIPNPTGAGSPLPCSKIENLPPVAKQKLYPALELTVIHATEPTDPKDRDKIDWKLITDLTVRSREEAIEKLRWYGLRWKMETLRRPSRWRRRSHHH
jgi:hypothetical protein